MSVSLNASSLQLNKEAYHAAVMLLSPRVGTKGDVPINILSGIPWQTSQELRHQFFHFWTIQILKICKYV